MAVPIEGAGCRADGLDERPIAQEHKEDVVDLPTDVRHPIEHLARSHSCKERMGTVGYVQTLADPAPPSLTCRPAQIGRRQGGHAGGLSCVERIGRHGNAGVCRTQPLDLGICSSMLWPVNIFLQAREEAQWLD